MRSIISFNTFRRRKQLGIISSFDMPKFKFELPAPSDSANTYSKIKNLLAGENDFKKFDPKVSCTFDESSQTCNIKGSQFKAHLQVKPNDSASSKVIIEVEVPLALSLFKGKIQEAIEKNLKRIL
jgi:hypothetical protein